MASSREKRNSIKEIERKHAPTSLAFERISRGKYEFLKYLGKREEIPLSMSDQFTVHLEAENDIKINLERKFIRHVTGYMSIDGFLELLKDLGVSEPSIKEVCDSLAANKLDVTWSLNQEPVGEHSARVLRERHGNEPLGQQITTTPSTWEEAKAQLPRLRKWVEVKAEAGLTKRRKAGFDQEVYDLLIGHLRDNETGLGKWATSAEGLPRNILRHVDSGLRQELYALGNPGLPSDVHLPAGKPTGRPLGATDSEKRAYAPRPNRVPRTPTPSAEELREAWRIAKRGRRRTTLE